MKNFIGKRNTRQISKPTCRSVYLWIDCYLTNVIYWTGFYILWDVDNEYNYMDSALVNKVVDSGLSRRSFVMVLKMLVMISGGESWEEKSN